jgi:enoyl-CoA hydratase
VHTKKKMSGRIRVSRRKGGGGGGKGGDGYDICVVTLSDAATKNSLDRTSLRELAGTVARESTRSSSSSSSSDVTKCIVLTGEGDAFSSGIDLKGAPEVFGMDEFDYESDPVYQMEKCEIPIICVVPGVAINAGFEIALAADVILVTRNARFIDTHMELGLLPSWGLSSKLSRAIGINNAKLVSAFRETLSGEEAVRLGLAQKKVFDGKQEAMEEAMKLARRMIEKSRSKERARVALEVIDKGFEKPYGDARMSERKNAFAQYRSLPLEDTFSRPRRRERGERENVVASAAEGEIRSKL